MNRRNTILIVIFVILIFTVLGGGTYYFFKKEIITSKTITKNQENKTKHPLCLSESKQADFKVERLGKYPSVEYNKGFIEIVVKEITTDKEITKFKIDDINPDLAHSLEIHKCGIYVLKGSNFNEFKSWYEKYGIWYYTYNGEGKVLISNKDYHPYSLDFRINLNEKYIVLERGYLGLDDYALVIKDLKTKEDIFELLIKNIVKQYPNIIGNFDMREWTKDGRYFWGDIFVGANVLAFFRIDTSNWVYDIFPAPQDVLGGDALNVENGYITVHPGNVWFGIVEFTEEEKTKRRAQGIGTEIYIYNLFTKERHLVDKTDEPLWFFKPKWISDTELEYELPTGEKKIYKIK